MKSEKKCPNCAEWTFWDKQPTDRCTHCNELLDPETLKRIEQHAEAERVYQENDFLRIRETDGTGMRAVRMVARVFHVIFAAIAWFFLWMVTTFSG